MGGATSSHSTTCAGAGGGSEGQGAAPCATSSPAPFSPRGGGGGRGGRWGGRGVLGGSKGGGKRGILGRDLRHMGRVRIDGLSDGLQDGGSGEEEETRDGGEEWRRGRGGGGRRLQGEGLHRLQVWPVSCRLGWKRLGFLIRHALGRPRGGAASRFGIFGLCGGGGGDLGLVECENRTLTRRERKGTEGWRRTEEWRGEENSNEDES